MHRRVGGPCLLRWLKSIHLDNLKVYWCSFEIRINLQLHYHRENKYVFLSRKFLFHRGCVVRSINSSRERKCLFPRFTVQAKKNRELFFSRLSADSQFGWPREKSNFFFEWVFRFPPNCESPSSSASAAYSAVCNCNVEPKWISSRNLFSHVVFFFFIFLSSLFIVTRVLNAWLLEVLL